MFAAFRMPSDREIFALVALLLAALLLPPLIGGALGARGAGSKRRYSGALACGAGAGVVLIGRALWALLKGELQPGLWWVVPSAIAAGALTSYALARLVARGQPPSVAKD